MDIHVSAWSSAATSTVMPTWLYASITASTDARRSSREASDTDRVGQNWTRRTRPRLMSPSRSAISTSEYCTSAEGSPASDLAASRLCSAAESLVRLTTRRAALWLMNSKRTDASACTSTVPAPSTAGRVIPESMVSHWPESLVSRASALNWVMRSWQVNAVSAPPVS